MRGEMPDRVPELTRAHVISFCDNGLHMSHFGSCQLTLIWLAHINLNYWQPTDSPARRSFVFMLNW